MASIRKKAITRWVGPDGKRCARTAAGARKVREESRKWYAFGLPGRTSPVPLASNRRVAEALFARLVAEGEAGAAGLPGAAEKGRTVAELIGDYRSHLVARGSTPRHADQTAGKLRRLASTLPWTAPRSLRADAVAQWLHRLVEEEGRGPQTRNHYLAQIRAFTRWLARPPRRLLPADLLDGLAMLPVAVDQRHARRALTAAELGRLLAATLASEDVVRDRTPAERHLMYCMAAATGFRAGELASLTAASLDLDASPPVALLASRRGKNRRPVRQPLPADVADLLRARVADLTPGQRLLPGGWHTHAADILRRDLEAAGIPYAIPGPDGPLYADFHSLRHTYVSLLESAGVSLRDAMQLARHTDPRLTLARYGRSQEEALGQAVAGLPVLGQPAADPGEDLERVLLMWIACGWAWWLAFGCLPGCLPFAHHSNPPTDGNGHEAAAGGLQPPE